MNTIPYKDLLLLDRRSKIVDYTNSIIDVFPSYREESKSNRDAMNVVMSIAYPVKKEEYYLILHDYIVASGVTYKKAMDMLKKYPAFIDSGEEPSKFYQKAKRWLITKEGLQIYKNEITGINVYYRVEGKTRGKLVSEDKIPRILRGKTVADYVHSATIDVKAIQAYHQENGDNMKDKELAELCRILEVAKYKNGEMDQEYFRKNTGRLYAYGSGSMQTMRKPVRRAAFNGCYDIDLCNAHYRVASHFTENEFIQEYAYSTSLIRKVLSNDLDIGIGDVKLLLLTLLYGAGTSGKSNSTLAKEFGKDKLKEILNHSYIKNMIYGIEELTEDLQMAGHIQLADDADQRTISRARAAFMQSYEAQILDACIEQVKPELLLFDGFITKENVSCEWLQEIVLDKTGMDIEIRKELI